VARAAASETVFLRRWQSARDQAEWLDFGLLALFSFYVRGAGVWIPKMRMSESA